ncbi:MAG: ABC transporter ATP-binding protein [Deltaproteobacteria bacterium]|nr:MAG: ABC transporter ATP-binding protein [Deltaproteobacteria bacterium]
MHADAVISGRGLELGYPGRKVLRGVDLDVRSGEFWFLLGPNGTGKTTLVRAILGLLPPLRGRIDLHPERARRDRLGFVPQRCELNPALSTRVREFVSLGFVGTRVPAAQRAERLRWALLHSGLEGLERADYWSLSGGQRQRALVARALVRRPGVILLDEPIGGLDVASEEVLLRALSHLNREHGVTIVFVTHQLAIAARYGTHVALFHAGTVEAGPRETILQSAAVERVFGVPVDLRVEGAAAATAAVPQEAP